MKILKEFVPYGIIIILIILLISKCQSSKEEINGLNKSWKLKEMMYSNNIVTLHQSVDKQGRQITMQESLIVTKEQEKEMLLIENERLRNVKSEVKIVIKTVIKEVYIPFEVTVYDTLSGDSAKPFNKKDDWYSLSGMVLKKGIRVDSLSFKNELTITIGEQSNGLFKKNTPVTEVINKNPYSSVTEMYNVTIKDSPKKFYQRKMFIFGTGLIVGAVLIAR